MEINMTYFPQKYINNPNGSDSIKSILRAIRFSKKIPYTTLNEFLFIKTILASCTTKIICDVIFAEWLHNLILDQLNRHRLIHGLEIISPNNTKAESASFMRQDFEKFNEHIEAWSVIYYCNFRSDLAFSIQELEKITAVSGRTLRRRQNLGYILVYNTIMRFELELYTH